MDETCIRCHAKVEYFDASGVAWCGNCRDRSNLVNAGYERDFREMKGKTFSIGGGADGWRGFALGAADDLITRVLDFLGRPSRPEVWGPALIARLALAKPTQTPLDETPAAQRDRENADWERRQAQMFYAAA